MKDILCQHRSHRKQGLGVLPHKIHCKHSSVPLLSVAPEESSYVLQQHSYRQPTIRAVENCHNQISLRRIRKKMPWPKSNEILRWRGDIRAKIVGIRGRVFFNAFESYININWRTSAHIRTQFLHKRPRGLWSGINFQINYFQAFVDDIVICLRRIR